MKDMDTKTNAELARSPAWRKIMRFYRTLKPGLWLMKLPAIGPWVAQVVIREEEDANWHIPIGAVIPAGTNYILPTVVVERLLREADGIFAMSACPCRVAFKCQDHPHEIGCLHLGPAARSIPRQVGRELSLEEALAYFHDAAVRGLMPTILHMKSEAEIFEVDEARMLSVCLCCDCCCDVRLLLREGPNRYWDLYNHRMPGVRIEVSDACTLCGDCIQACYGGARVIMLGSHKAEIHARCLACGHCIPVCPVGAISLVIDPGSDVLEELLARISRRVRIDGS
jgi:UDP-glucose 4-epimerase